MTPSKANDPALLAENPAVKLFMSMMKDNNDPVIAQAALALQRAVSTTKPPIISFPITPYRQRSSSNEAYTYDASTTVSNQESSQLSSQQPQLTSTTSVSNHELLTSTTIVSNPEHNTQPTQQQPPICSNAYSLYPETPRRPNQSSCATVTPNMNLPNHTSINLFQLLMSAAAKSTPMKTLSPTTEPQVESFSKKLEQTALDNIVQQQDENDEDVSHSATNIDLNFNIIETNDIEDDDLPFEPNASESANDSDDGDKVEQRTTKKYSKPGKKTKKPRKYF